MARNRRHFRRPLGTRRYRKLFVLAVEGATTEPQYFALFNDQHSVIHVDCVKGNHRSAPQQVLKRMKIRLGEEGLSTSDEAWLVVDKDSWTEDQLDQLHAWSQERESYGLALSNPKFEYWLLLHFENAKGIRTARDCRTRLKRHLPDYDKHIDRRMFPLVSIREAIARAQVRDNPPCKDWPRRTGTTVYRLVERLLGVSDG